MVRRPDRISVVDELIFLYTGNPGQKRWFGRKMKEVDEATRKEVWDAIKRKGLDVKKPKAAAPKKPTPRIVWTDQEWDRLGEIVWTLRKHDPSESLIALANRAMPQFPADRRRIIRVMHELKPLAFRLQEHDVELVEQQTAFSLVKQELEQAKVANEQLKTQLDLQPNRDEILGTLTDEEVLNHFRERVLSLIPPADIVGQMPVEAVCSMLPFADLAAQTLRQGIELFMDGRQENVNLLTKILEKPVPTTTASPPITRPPMPMPRPAVRKSPKVTVIGLLPDQQRKVEAKLQDRAVFNFVDKNRKPDAALADTQDVLVLMINFIGHSVEKKAKSKVEGTNTQLILHHGGIETLVRKLDGILPQLAASA